MHAAARRTVAATLAVVTAVLALCALVRPADARPFQPSGATITGGRDAGSAVALTPGSYVDRLAAGSDSTGSDGSSLFYAIETARGETPYLAATVGVPASASDEESISLSISLSAPGDDSTCADNRSYSITGDPTPVNVTVSPGAVGTGDEDACPAGTLIAEVTRGGDAAAATPVPFELSYRLEPRVTATSGLPSAAGTSPASLEPRLVGPAARLRSGTTYATAPLIGSGVYGDTLDGDDFHVVRVHLDWGQRFAYRVTFAGRDGGAGSVDVKAVVRNPARQPVTTAPGTDSVYSLDEDPGGDRLTGATFAPVRYENRTSTQDAVSGYDIAGDYYFVLTTTENDDFGGDAKFSYTLQVQVFGEPSGSPSYAAPTSGASTVQAAAEDGTGNVPAAVAVGAAAVVVLLGIAIVGLRGRRRRHA
ncbi:hypothetical protein [Jatrophihabitans fulvus]